MTEYEGVRDLLTRGIAAAKAKDLAEARFYLEWVLRCNPNHAQQVECFLWLSEIAKDPQEKRAHLEMALALNPAEPRARRRLAVLNGILKPGELVNPDAVHPPQAQVRPVGDARRFTCPNCGSPMSYTPDGEALTCEYCESRQRLRSQVQAAKAAPTEDFVLALATATGHVQPVNSRTFACQGCGAQFLLPPERLTLTCPYCESPYVVENKEALKFIPPGEVIPFAISEPQAKQALKQWLDAYLPGEQVRVAPGLGIYLPVWSFNMGGFVEWRAELHNGDHWVPSTGARPVAYRSILVAATPRLQEAFNAELKNYDLAAVVPYDPRYLANWVAETYQIPVAQASLEARRLALDREKDFIATMFIQPVRNLSFSSGGMIVDTFRLLLAPAWLTHYTLKNEQYTVFINGQSGRVRAEKPVGQVRGWFERLLG
ncbi:MAG TPA: hypothetical protein VIO61_06225 [Anaerolineaceae bacterium]